MPAQKHKNEQFKDKKINRLLRNHIRMLRASSSVCTILTKSAARSLPKALRGM